MEETFNLVSIGKIRLEKDNAFIDIAPKYQEALLGLDKFSHIMVFYWFHQNDNAQDRSILQLRPRANPRNPVCGVFATHSPRRPNLIALTTCRVLSVDGPTIAIDTIDAKGGSPVIDIKCYIPDAVEATGVNLPDWVKNRDPR